MKKWARGLVVCAAAAVLSIGAACMAYAAEGEINVNGTGVVQADPDTADISLEISTDGKAAQAAQKENNRITGSDKSHDRPECKKGRYRNGVYLRIPHLSLQ